MGRITKDPLLGVAHVILALDIAILVFVEAMLLIGLGAIFTVERDHAYAQIAEAGAPDSAYWAIVAVIVLVGGLLLAGLRFILELRGIVKTVDGGDPFEPENANRLSRMGWLTVAIYGLALTAGAVAAWVKSVAGAAGEKVDLDFDLGGGGIVLILTLFILARVFRQGAVMREDLEGTV